MAIIQCPKCGTQLTEGQKFCPNCGNAVSLATQMNMDDDRTILLSGQRQNMPDAEEDNDKTVWLYQNQSGNVSGQNNMGQNMPPLGQTVSQANPVPQVKPIPQVQQTPQAGQPASKKAKRQKAASKKAKKEHGKKKGTALIAVICVEAGLLVGVAAVIILLFLGIL